MLGYLFFITSCACKNKCQKPYQLLVWKNLLFWNQILILKNIVIFFCRSQLSIFEDHCYSVAIYPFRITLHDNSVSTSHLEEHAILEPITIWKNNESIKIWNMVAMDIVIYLHLQFGLQWRKYSETCI